MLCRRQISFWLYLLILLSIVTMALAKKHKHHDDDDDDNDDDNDNDDHDDDKDNDDYDDDYDHEDKGDKEEVKVEKPEFITPQKEEWLEDIDFSIVKGRVRPIGSGICKNAKCDGSDNERCFETCGNMATPDDIYGCPTEKTWALTFDDGPSNFTSSLLDILNKADVKVTFCVMGAHAKQFPDIIKRAYEDGHQIASHTYSHPHLMSLTNEQIVYEVRATEEVIEKAIGVKPTYIRPPYGEADGRVKALLKQMGYKTLMWNVDPVDYNVHMLKDGAQLIQKAFDNITSGMPNPLNAHKDPGYISLQHDLYNVSIDQVPEVIKKLKAKGYEFTTAAECLGDKRPHRKTDSDDEDDDDDDDNDVEADMKQDAVPADSSIHQDGHREQVKVASHVASSANTLAVSAIFLTMALLGTAILI